MYFTHFIAPFVYSIIDGTSVRQDIRICSTDIHHRFTANAVMHLCVVVCMSSGGMTLILLKHSDKESGSRLLL